MADSRDPPPLFNNVDIDQRDYDNEDLFTSAVEVRFNLIIYNCMYFSIPASIVNSQVL